jgi:tetratricopeptide (TPR) repeat protein
VLARILDLDPVDDDAIWFQSHVEQRLGVLSWQTDDTARAIRHLEAAAARYRAYAVEGRLCVELPGVLCNLALVIFPDDPDRARGLWNEALGLSRDLVARADDVENRRVLAWVLFDIAQVNAGDPQTALPLAREAAALMERDPDDPQVPVVRAAMVEGFAAATAELLGRSAEALPHALRAVALARRSVEADATVAARRVLLASVIQLARIEQALGDYGDAALRLGEAEGMIGHSDFADVPGLADLAASMRAIAEAQPRLN